MDDISRSVKMDSKKKTADKGVKGKGKEGASKEKAKEEVRHSVQHSKAQKTFSQKTFYVTTPIYYPNDVPHIGHAYTTIAADIINRWYKLDGYDTFFLTGTDEHGKKIDETAAKNGMPVKKFVDELAVEFKKAWAKLDIKYDRFIRTTDSDHERNVQEIIRKVNEKGDIYKDVYEGLYCTACESFYLEKDLVDGKCPVHKTAVENIKEESYFFRLSKYRNQLLKFYEENPDFIFPRNRAPEIIARVREELKDLSITRKTLKWGIPFPLDKTHTTYVWFDALSNYLSGINYYFGDKEKDSTEKKRFWPPNCQLIGKDIIWFHCVIWPAMLLSLGIPMPKMVFVHGWWTIEGEKVSKTRGNIISVEQLAKYGADSARYYLFRAVPFGADGNYAEKEFAKVINSELADGFGNLVTRTSALIVKFLDKKIPEALPKDYHEDANDRKLRETSIAALKNCREHIKSVALDKIIQEIWLLIKESNRYITITEPWVLAKKDKTRLHAVIFNLVQSIRYISLLISPFTPEASEKVSNLFNFKEKAFEELDWKNKNSGIIEKEIKLFEKIDSREKEKCPFCLKIAKVVSVEDHPNAEKLYVLKINLGEEERQLVAGLRGVIPKEKILNSSIVVVSNLKPKTLRGIESKGMLLAASKDGRTVLIKADGKPGEELSCNDFENSREELSIEEFAKIKLEIKGKKLLYKGFPIKSATGFVTADIEDGAEVR